MPINHGIEETEIAIHREIIPRKKIPKLSHTKKETRGVIFQLWCFYTRETFNVLSMDKKNGGNLTKMILF